MCLFEGAGDSGEGSEEAGPLFVLLFAGVPFVDFEVAPTFGLDDLGVTRRVDEGGAATVGDDTGGVLVEAPGDGDDFGTLLK